MKFISAVFLWLSLSSVAVAQNALSQGLPSKSLAKGTWDLGLFGGGGPGLEGADDTQFVYAGGRVGRILTREHFSGWRRGNFEWAVELMPVYTVITPKGAVYGGSFRPAVWQWNFTSGKKIAPYVAVGGGILLSTSNIPPGNTSHVNFTSQGAFGAHIFLGHGRALRLEGAIVHHSNAGLGKLNPGYNASLLFAIGYTWFKGPK